MNKERIKFFIKEVLIFTALIIILPIITAYIVSSIMAVSDYGKNFEFENIISLSREIVIATYLITPLTAKLPNFGKINRWWRFFIIYMILS